MCIHGILCLEGRILCTYIRLPHRVVLQWPPLGCIHGVIRTESNHHLHSQNPSTTSVDVLQCWFQKADDMFTSIDKNHIHPFCAFLNNIHPDIQWTLEIEKERRFNMLDVTIIRDQDGHLEFEVYRKPTHTGQYIHHNSIVPHQSKEATVRALTMRVDTIPSKPEARRAEHLRVRRDLALNGYTEACTKGKNIDSTNARTHTQHIHTSRYNSTATNSHLHSYCHPTAGTETPGPRVHPILQRHSGTYGAA
jgi:hypothetical protein